DIFDNRYDGVVPHQVLREDLGLASCRAVPDVDEQVPSVFRKDGADTYAGIVSLAEDQCLFFGIRADPAAIDTRPFLPVSRIKESLFIGRHRDAEVSAALENIGRRDAPVNVEKMDFQLVFSADANAVGQQLAVL